MYLMSRSKLLHVCIWGSFLTKNVIEKAEEQLRHMEKTNMKLWPNGKWSNYPNE